jgi:NAD-dependent SIR2 family protein deacetylase
MNGEWLERLRVTREGEVPSAPDGDADLPAADLASFRVPDCTSCGGVLKPDVVFFGENVPREWADAAWSLLEQAEVLLVVGSSLTVFSGRRFVYGARKADKPVAIVNVGPTRADDLAEVKLEAQLGTTLPRLARELIGAENGPEVEGPARIQDPAGPRQRQRGA